MSFLDVRTVMFSQVVTDAMCTGVLLLLWVRYRKRFAGIAYLLLDFGFQTAAIVLILLRGSVPAVVSTVVANTLVVSGAYLGREDQLRHAQKMETVGQLAGGGGARLQQHAAGDLELRGDGAG